MPNYEFPMGAYLQAFQNKYAQEEAQKPKIGEALAQGITSGVNMAVNMHQKDKEQYKEAYLEYLKRETKDRPLLDNSNKELGPDVAAEVIAGLYSDKITHKTNKNGDIVLATKNGQMLPYHWGPKTGGINFVDVTPTAEDIQFWQQSLPGYTLQAGQTIRVPKSTYEVVARGVNKPKKTEETPEDKLARLEQEAAARARGADSITGKTGTQQLNIATQLRKEFNDMPEVKSFTSMARSYKIMQSALNEALSKKGNESKSAADQALVITFNKMLDPTSVVRESEYARTPEGQSAMAQLEGFVERVKQGGVGLTDENRKSVVSISGKLMTEAQNVYRERRDEFSRLAQDDYKIDPQMVVGRDYSLPGLDAGIGTPSPVPSSSPVPVGNGTSPKPSPAPTVGKVQVTIELPDGRRQIIPAINLEKAKLRVPGLKVISQ